MNKNVSVLTKIIAVAFITALFAMGASAQIRIGGITIGKPKPDPKQPPTTNPNQTTPNPNGNRTPTTTPNANTRPTSNTRPTANPNVETGATDEQVRAFNKDMEPYRNGIQQLMYMARSKASNPSCRELPSVRKALTAGAAFLEIIKQKYPGIENQKGYSNEDIPYHTVGDVRRWAENREEIAKTCVNQLLGAKVAEQVAGVNSAIAEFEKREGYVLGAELFRQGGPTRRIDGKVQGTLCPGRYHNA